MNDQPPKAGLTTEQRRKLIAVVVISDLLVLGAFLYYVFMVRPPASP